jgi:protein-S-isoprenylcysteine O-methyltransferase Ste14
MPHSVASLARALSLLLLLALVVAGSRPNVGWLIAGIPFVAVGETIRIWAVGHLTKSVELVTSGPYRRVRHPLYLGRLLIFTGICLGSPLPHGLHLVVLAAGMAIFHGYYLPRKEGVEPKRLEALHGEAYRRYHQSVPTLIPRLRPFDDGPERRWSLARFSANREIWMVALLAGWAALQISRL